MFRRVVNSFGCQAIQRADAEIQVSRHQTDVIEHCKQRPRPGWIDAAWVRLIWGHPGSCSARSVPMFGLD